MGAGGETSAAPEDIRGPPFPSVKGQALPEVKARHVLRTRTGVKGGDLSAETMKTAEKVRNEKSESPGLKGARLGIGPLSWAASLRASAEACFSLYQGAGPVLSSASSLFLFLLAWEVRP